MTIVDHLAEIARKLTEDVGYPFQEGSTTKDEDHANKLFATGLAVGSIMAAASDWEKRMQF